MQGNKYLIILTLAFAILGCQKELTPDEYQDYVTNPDNGLRKDQVIGDFELSVIYEPVDYLIAKSPDLYDNDNLKSELDDYEHFQFRIKLNQGGNILMYDETDAKNEVTRINHFSFYAKNDFKVISGSDTTDCRAAHYSRNYNLSPTVDLSLAFDPIDRNSDWQLVYTDQQYNLGRVKFLFKQEDLNDLPALKL